MKISQEKLTIIKNLGTDTIRNIVLFGNALNYSKSQVSNEDFKSYLNYLLEQAKTKTHKDNVKEKIKVFNFRELFAIRFNDYFFKPENSQKFDKVIQQGLLEEPIVLDFANHFNIHKLDAFKVLVEFLNEVIVPCPDKIQIQSLEDLEKEKTQEEPEKPQNFGKVSLFNKETINDIVEFANIDSYDKSLTDEDILNYLKYLQATSPEKREFVEQINSLNFAIKIRNSLLMLFDEIEETDIEDLKNGLMYRHIQEKAKEIFEKNGVTPENKEKFTENFLYAWFRELLPMKKLSLKFAGEKPQEVATEQPQPQTELEKIKKVADANNDKIFIVKSDKKTTEQVVNEQVTTEQVAASKTQVIQQNVTQVILNPTNDLPKRKELTVAEIQEANEHLKQLFDKRGKLNERLKNLKNFINQPDSDNNKFHLLSSDDSYSFKTNNSELITEVQKHLQKYLTDKIDKLDIEIKAYREANL